MELEYTDSAELGSESSEWGESSEWESEMAEARRARRPASPGRYTQPVLKGYVTQTQFQTALDKVRNDVGQNAKAISGVGRQVDAVSKRARTELKTLRDEVIKTRDETRNTLQTLAILPLLASGGVVSVNPAGGGPAVNVATPPDSLSQLLPLLMLSGGLGGASGGAGGMDGGLMLAVALIAAGHH